MTANKPYKEVNPQGAFPALEKRLLEFWQNGRIFERSVELRPIEREYVFYDGPPFANGLPHYGHLVTGYVKDIIPRYKTMRGYRVERRFGWDCHGLPAEMEAEKELKISGRQAIQEYGIEKFNEYCRTSVLRYTKDWESYVTRQARWVDFSNDYKTMDLSYMESVIWAFKQLWDKGLVYEGYRVMPYSWACETPLSNFETRLDNSYRPRQDPAVTVLFKLLPEGTDPRELYLLAWTTTPWTLPSNLAIALGAEIDYAIMQEGNKHYVLAEAALEKYEAQLKEAKKVGTLKGQQLAGKRYEPLFPYFKDAPNAFKVLVGEFVNTDEGTGVVHIAPGFGEDDQKLCAEHGIEIVCPVDAAGRFTSEVSDFEGQNVLESNKNVIKNLKERGVLVKHETYVHNYPHCWRTDTPLIYRAISSWYVEVTKFRDRLGELNKQINWIPDHIRDGQFGKWLENARDWSISRNRFWGSPIPVWKSDNPDFPRIDVYGSLDELERDFGVRPQNLHRPYIDQLTRPNPDDPSGKSTMRRVEEVLDCWFESGSMPYAQVHYPFENKEWFENHFPADFIVEYVAQTRGWFYNLVVLAGALFDCPPFRNCMCHGVVLDENGQKLSKRLKNYPSPEEVFEKHGSDALRWYLVSSAILNGGDLQIDRDGKGIGEVVRTVLNPIWNAYYFFTLYANSDGIRAEYDTSSPELLDRYILSKTRELVEKTSALMDSYALAGACQAILQYVDALNNWYIRRSRDRFWKAEKDEDKRRAYNTLFVALINLTKVAAPLLPFLSEELFKELTGEESVHFANWPDGKDLPDDKDLVAQMDQVRNICSTTLALRESNGLRIRLPLQRLTVAGNGAQALAPYEHLIADEVNVKQVQFSEEIAAFATFQLVVNARELGPKLGSAMKDVLSATRSGEWQLQNDGSVEIAGQKLLAGEYKMALKPKEGEAAQALDSNDLVAVLDINLTQQLEEEGTARDLVRLVQQTRKEAGLHVADHIVLELNLPEELKEVIKKHERYLSEQTLSDKINFTLTAANSFKQSGSLAGKAVEIGVTRI